jgi:hypothetical protein
VIKLTVTAPCAPLPPAAEPFHSWDFHDGTPWTRFYRTPTGFLLRFPNLADFKVSTDGHQVTCTPAPDVSAATVEHLYLNQVLPLALSKQGNLVFHGSAVEAAGAAIAFLAESGRGKSTLAATFAINGYRFLTDDGLVLERGDRGYIALPSHPSVRLWDDSHERLLGAEVAMAPALEYTSKARFLAGSKITHCDQPRPLLTAYFLGDGSTEEITFRRLSEVETLIEWAKHSFLLDVEDKALIGGYFDRIAALANHLVCYYLDYPRRYDDLSRLLEVVVMHANKLSRPA